MSLLERSFAALLAQASWEAGSDDKQTLCSPPILAVLEFQFTIKNRAHTDR